MTDTGSGRDAHQAPKAVMPANTSVAARLSRAAGRQNRMVMLWIGLAAVIRLLRDPRFQARVITGIIGLAVLRRAVQESNAHTRERLIAWDQRHQPPHQHHAGTQPPGGPR